MPNAFTTSSRTNWDATITNRHARNTWPIKRGPGLAFLGREELWVVEMLQVPKAGHGRWRRLAPLRREVTSVIPVGVDDVRHRRRSCDRLQPPAQAQRHLPGAGPRHAHEHLRRGQSRRDGHERRPAPEVRTEPPLMGCPTDEVVEIAARERAQSPRRGLGRTARPRRSRRAGTSGERPRAQGENLADGAEAGAAPPPLTRPPGLEECESSGAINLAKWTSPLQPCTGVVDRTLVE